MKILRTSVLGWLCMVCIVNVLALGRLPGSVFSTTCPPNGSIQEEQKKIKNYLIHHYDRELSCSCGGVGNWTRVAYLNMSDTNQQCPSNWNLTSSPVRGCGRSSSEWSTCDSVIYPVNGRIYSSVCGRINAYQKGRENAFYIQRDNIESTYVSGVSITHGAPGSRRHIWTFAAAIGYHCPDFSHHLCPCSNNNTEWPYRVPSFIGNDYFCESGRHIVGDCTDELGSYYPDDLLWDGQGCPASSTCCGLNSPPWFCTTLPDSTSDDLEIRLCGINTVPIEDTLLSSVDIYVK